MPKSDNHGALYRVSPRDTSFYDDFLGYVMSIIPSTMTEFIWAPLTPELIVTDIKASLRFWRDLCGFRVAFERPNKGFAYLDLDGAQIMLEERDQSRNWIVGPMEPPPLWPRHQLPDRGSGNRADPRFPSCRRLAAFPEAGRKMVSDW
jgi:hypothetical protein